jgi:hypothetical protein
MITDLSSSIFLLFLRSIVFYIEGFDFLFFRVLLMVYLSVFSFRLSPNTSVKFGKVFMFSFSYR